MKILLTGGAGYIGSHTYVELCAAGHEAVIVDNFYNSSPVVLERLETITGKPVPFYEADICDLQALDAIFKKHAFDAIITIPGYGGGYNVTLHFSGTHKMCTETVADPDSMNGETVMLYFYKSDGSGTYTQPIISGSTYNFASASVDVSYNNLNVSVSPLPDYNSSTTGYYDPETTFGFKVYNYESTSESNSGDFLWLKFQEESNGSWVNTIINTEWLEPDGSYTGNY